MVSGFGLQQTICVARKKSSLSLIKNFRESLKLGNNSSLAALGKGNVGMEVNVIIGVFYVPDLKNNLLSIGSCKKRVLPLSYNMASA